MYNLLSQRFQHHLNTEVDCSLNEFYPLEVYERSVPEIEFFSKNYECFNKLVRKCHHKKRVLWDIILSMDQKYKPCSAEVALANNFTLKNLAFLKLHKSLKFGAFHRFNTFLEDYGYQSQMISCLDIPKILKTRLFELQQCERHSSLVVERSLVFKSYLKYRIIPGTEAYNKIIIRFNAYESELTLSLLDSFAMIGELKHLTHSLFEATNLFYDNVASMKKYVFYEI